MHMLLPIGVDEMVDQLITHLSIHLKLDLKLKYSQVGVAHFQGTCEAPQPGLQQHGPLLRSEQVDLQAGAPQLARHQEYHGQLEVLANVDDHPGFPEEHLPYGAAWLASDDV